MQQEFLRRLTVDVRSFVEEVEIAAGIRIEVVTKADQNGTGPLGLGKLKVEIEAHRVRLFAPTDGYFPDGGVRHEVLHVHRLHIEGIPRIALADAVDWNPNLESSLVQVDNALEHLVIVPKELEKNPERLEHWEAVMSRMWQEALPTAPSDLGRRIGVCLHWAFLRHVLPRSKFLDSAQSFMGTHGLKAYAENFVWVFWDTVTGDSGGS